MSVQRTNKLRTLLVLILSPFVSVELLEFVGLTQCAASIRHDVGYGTSALGKSPFYLGKSLCSSIRQCCLDKYNDLREQMNTR